jgi:hypothetical protein
MDDDLLVIPQFLKDLADDDLPERKWVEPVIEERKIPKNDGTFLIVSRKIKEGYWLVDGKRQEKDEIKSDIRREPYIKRLRSSGRQREEWLTDIIRRHGPIGTKTLYKLLVKENLEPHEGFIKHYNYQAHMRSILIRLKRKGILCKKNSKYLIRDSKSDNL